MTMQTKKLFSLLFFVLILISVLFINIIPVKSEESYTVINGFTPVQEQHPSTSIYKSAVGFTLEGFSSNIGSVTFLMARKSTSTSLIQVWVYSCDTNNVSTAKPTSTVLAKSNLVNPNTLPDSVTIEYFVWTEFLFSGENIIYLYPNVIYCFAMCVIGGNIDEINRWVTVAEDNTEGNPLSDTFHYKNSAWEDVAFDANYIVKTSYEVGEEEEATPIAIANYMVMFILLFVPAMMLAGWCYKSDYPPMVGFISGLTLSVAIGLLTGLVPAWLLFVCVIVIILLLFNMVKPKGVLG